MPHAAVRSQWAPELPRAHAVRHTQCGTRACTCGQSLDRLRVLGGRAGMPPSSALPVVIARAVRYGPGLLGAGRLLAPAPAPFYITPSPKLLEISIYMLTLIDGYGAN